MVSNVPMRVCEVAGCQREILAGYVVCRGDWQRIPAPVRACVADVLRRREDLTPELYAVTCHLTVAIATTYRELAEARKRAALCNVADSPKPGPVSLVVAAGPPQSS